MSDGARRAGLLAGIAGVVIVTLASLYTALTYVGVNGQSYSPFNHWVSELGERGVSGSAFVFNAGLVVTGICFVAFMLALRRDVPGLLGLAGVVIGVVACVAASLVGVFPMDDLASHARVALTFFGLGWIAVLVLTAALYRNDRVGMGIVALAIATAACFVGFLLVAFSGHEVGDALAAPTVRETFSLTTTLEWLLLVGVNLWVLLVAIRLLRDDPAAAAARTG